LRLERAQLGLLAALAATIPVSIFASEAVFLSLSVLVLAVRLATRGARFPATPLDTPVVSLMVWTLLAASFARDPARSHEDAKKLVLFALFYVAVEVLARERDRERILSAALLGGLALAGLMVLQRHFLGYDHLDRRPNGFLGHYMSASGVTMGVLVLAVARLAFGPRPRRRAAGFALPLLVLGGVGAVAAATAAGHGIVATRLCVAALGVLSAAVALSGSPAARAAEAALPAVVAPVAAWALVASQTRSAWVGAVAGLAVLAFLRAPRLLWVVGAATAAILVLRPDALTERLTIADASSRDRYYMWQAGLDMILDKPVFGQGPGMILVEYPRYRWAEATHPMQPHLHNNLMQFAAERGLPGLAFLLWWAIVALATALREARRSEAGWPAAGALAALVAVFVAGLFEYNLGDSEVLMLLLLLTAVPFALARDRSAAA
jgi:O-antigen ligase